MPLGAPGLALGAAYAVGEPSVTYPLACGLAPVFLIVVGVTTGIVAIALG